MADRDTSKPAEEVPASPDTSPENLLALARKSIQLLNRFQMEGNRGCLDESISGFLWLVKAAPADHPMKIALLHNLALALFQRFVFLGQILDINSSIEYWVQALHLTPDGHPDKLDRINNLGMAYLEKFQRTRDLDALSSAISHFDSAILHCPSGHVVLPGLLNNLGSAYSIRFEFFGRPSDIDQAITHQTHSIALIPTGHPARLGWLKNLGTSYMLRFQHQGKIDDINSAISSLDESVASTPESDSCRAARSSSRGNAYQRRFELLGSIADIDQAISCQALAVSITPRTAPRDRSQFLNNLGIAYACRYRFLTMNEDLQNGIEALEEAALFCPEDDLLQGADIASNIGGLRVARYQRLKELEDLGLAIEHMIHAASIWPDEHPEKSGLLNNLAATYGLRYTAIHEDSDFEQAVTFHLQVLSMISENHPNRHRYLGDLGNLYYQHYRLAEDRIDSLNKAVRYQFEGMNLCPDDYADKAARLYSLASTVAAQCRVTSDRTKFEATVTLLKVSALSPNSPAFDRFKSAKNLARLLSLNDPARALEGYEIVMDLLPTMIWLGYSLSRRYQNISGISKAVSEAVSAAIVNNRYDTAIEWLESGHSIVWRQILQLRTPVDELERIDPEIASKLKRVSQELEQAGSLDPFGNEVKDLHGSILVSGEQALQKQHALAKEWDALVERARNKPDLQHFLRPKQLKELVQAAYHGDIVAVHIAENACGALIIRRHDTRVTYLRLPNTSYEKIANAYNRMKQTVNTKTGRVSTQRGVRKDRIPLDQDFHFVLGMTWTDVVKPIMENLGYLDSNSSELPRIIWCTTGPLTFVPLHAAGIYPSGEKTFNYVVSSYTPSLGALIRSSVDPNFTGVLAVGQSETSGQAYLPGTTEELKRAARFFEKQHFIRLEGTSATSSNVLSAIESHSWVHLACHASQNSSAPGTSAFYLHDGPLRLSTIMGKSLKHADFAFLSACQTASGDESMPDEAVHLAAGMLMAGYRTVIGTMWSIRDEDAPIVAEKVYEYMMRDGKADSAKAAHALHHAVQVLRDEIGESSFASWVPYIHIGI